METAGDAQRVQDEGGIPASLIADFTSNIADLGALRLTFSETRDERQHCH